MTLALAEPSKGDLPTLIDRAAFTLTQARSAAEILDAKEVAELAYDLARRQSRLEKAKGAHDELASAALRLQADANEIIAAAQRRLADEYDAAQKRGEVGQQTGRPAKVVSAQNDIRPASAAEIGLTRKDIHEARVVRDAEAASPGVTRRVLDDMLEKGQEPTKTALNRALKAVVDPNVSSAADRAEQNERDRQREEHRAALPEGVRDQLAIQEAYRRKSAGKAPTDDRLIALEDEVAALKAENGGLEAELAARDKRIADLARLEKMEALFAQEGVDGLLAAKDRVIESKDAMLRTQGESLDRWMRECLGLRKRLKIEQPETKTIIDMQTGEVRHV